jgi:hypothetical protein
MKRILMTLLMNLIVSVLKRSHGKYRLVTYQPDRLLSLPMEKRLRVLILKDGKQEV